MTAWLAPCQRHRDLTLGPVSSQPGEADTHHGLCVHTRFDFQITCRPIAKATGWVSVLNRLFQVLGTFSLFLFNDRYWTWVLSLQVISPSQGIWSHLNIVTFRASRIFCWSHTALAMSFWNVNQAPHLLSECLSPSHPIICHSRLKYIVFIS